MSTIPNKASFHFNELSVDICNTEDFYPTFRIYTDTESGNVTSVHHHMPIIRVTLDKDGRIVTHHGDQSITHNTPLKHSINEHNNVNKARPIPLETSEVCTGYDVKKNTFDFSSKHPTPSFVTTAHDIEVRVTNKNATTKHPRITVTNVVTGQTVITVFTDIGMIIAVEVQPNHDINIFTDERMVVIDNPLEGIEIEV